MVGKTYHLKYKMMKCISNTMVSGIKIKELLDGLKLYSEPICDDSYIKTKVKTFRDMIKTLFDGNEIPKERVEYTCIACISVDSVLKLYKKLSTSLFRTV